MNLSILSVPFGPPSALGPFGPPSALGPFGPQSHPALPGASGLAQAELFQDLEPMGKDLCSGVVAAAELT